MRKRSKFIIAAVIAVASICLAIFLLSVSLYGENRKIDDVVKTFFERIKNKEYQSVCLDFSKDNQKTFFFASGQCTDSLFLFELSLLKRYDLLNSNSYRVKINRTYFWTPFSQDSSMRVDIALEEEHKKSVDKALSLNNILGPVKNYFTAKKKSDALFVKSLLTVERRNGMWKITDINIDHNGIGPLYVELKGQLHPGRYVREAPDGFIIERVEVNARDLTPVDKRVLNYNLQKIQNLIGNK